jgi:type I restriction enzyme S subunit
MAVEWEVMTLRDAGVQLLDCEHRTPPPAEIGYPYIAIPQVKDGRLNLGDVRLISPEHFADWTRKTRPPPPH